MLKANFGFLERKISSHAVEDRNFSVGQIENSLLNKELNKKLNKDTKIFRKAKMSLNFLIKSEKPIWPKFCHGPLAVS